MAQEKTLAATLLLQKKSLLRRPPRKIIAAKARPRHALPLHVWPKRLRGPAQDAAQVLGAPLDIVRTTVRSEEPVHPAEEPELRVEAVVVVVVHHGALAEWEPREVVARVVDVGQHPM